MASWPVVSSVSCFIVTPSMMSWNFTLPAFSERIGTLYGSHWTKVSPFLILPPSLNGNDRADDDDVVFQFAAILAENGNGAVLVEHDVVAVLQLHDTQFVVTNHAVVLGLDLRNLEHLRRRAADVERPHRQLRAGLADGLRGDDADGLAELDERAGRKAAAVAMDADAVLAFAGQHRADADAVNARGFNRAWPCPRQSPRSRE